MGTVLFKEQEGKECRERAREGGRESGQESGQERRVLKDMGCLPCQKLREVNSFNSKYSLSST